MARTATWTNIGTDVTTCQNVEEILTKSGLNYEVEKRPIFLGNGYQIPNKVATVEVGTDRYIGTVSPSYVIYQNRDAFDFINQIPNIQYVKAGETRGGMVYIIGKLPSVTVLNDSFVPYVIFQTSHNGLYNVKATICPLRIVCQNQFAMSFKRMTNTIQVRHSASLVSKIEQAQQLITDTSIYMSGFSNTAEELALLKIGSDMDAYQIIDAFFNSTKEITARQKTVLEEKKTRLFDCYRADDNANFRGTAWGLVNAFTDFATHEEKKKTKNMNETKFMNVTFDTTMLNKLMEVMGVAVK